MEITAKQIIDSLFDVANEMRELIDDTYDENVSAKLDRRLDKLYEQYQTIRDKIK